MKHQKTFIMRKAIIDVYKFWLDEEISVAKVSRGLFSNEVIYFKLTDWLFKDTWVKSNFYKQNIKYYTCSITSWLTKFAKQNFKIVV